MRTNEEWLGELRAGGAARDAALEALRAYLLRALPGGLRRYGPAPPELLEDVVQDALLRVLAHLDAFEGRSRFTTWATTIAVRVAVSELRRRRWSDVPLDDAGPGLAAGADLVDPAASPEHRAAQSGIARALRRVLDRELSERQRTAVVAELNGMPQEEIGRHLGIGRNAVYKLGHDARVKLKRGLEAGGFDAAAIRAAFE